MITYPKTSSLEKAVYGYLGSIPNTTIHPNHPEDKSALTAGKARIVLTLLNDTKMGRFLTRRVAAPAFAFACYANTYPEARATQEAVIEKFESWNPADLAMEGQRLETAHLVSVIGSVIDRKSGLFVAEVVYRFNLSLL